MKTTAEEAQEILRLVGAMEAIPNFPPAGAAKEAIAEAITRLCATLEQAQKISEAAIEKWSTWRGVPGLRDLYERIYPPEKPPGNQAKDYGPKPPVDCTVCNDFGYYWQDEKNHWCNCAQGEKWRTKIPHLVDGLNRKRTKAPEALRTSTPRPPITQADIDKEFQSRQDRTNEMLERAQAILVDESSSRDQREIAREIIRGIPRSPKIN